MKDKKLRDSSATLPRNSGISHFFERQPGGEIVRITLRRITLSGKDAFERTDEPKFYRPELVAAWLRNGTLTPATPATARIYTLRPPAAA